MTEANQPLLDALNDLHGKAAALTGDSSAAAELQASLEQIADIAHDYAGIQDCCLLLAEQIGDALSEYTTLPDELVSLTVQWLDQLRRYFDNPGDSHAANAMLSVMQHVDWPTPLPDADVAVLRDLLITTESSPATHSLQQVWQQVVDQLAELKNDTDSIKSLDAALGHFIDALASSEQLGLQDCSVFLQQNISDLTEQGLDDVQTTLLSAWLSLMQRCLNNPEDSASQRALVTNLCDTHWPAPLSPDDAAVLYEVFGLEPVPASVDSPDTTGSDLPAADVASGAGNDWTERLLLHEILASTEADTDDNISAIHAGLADLALAAGDQEQLGIQDICLLLQQQLDDLQAAGRQLDAAQLALLHRWSDSLADYCAGNHTAAEQLLAVLADPVWPMPMADSDADILRDMLDLPAAASATHDTADIQTPDIQHATAVESDDIPAQPHDTDSESNNNIIIPPPIPHAISQELIDMLVSEAGQIEEEARQQAQSWSSETATPALREDALAQFALRIERLGSAAQAAELAGLHQACLVLHRNMELLGKHNNQPTAWCSDALLEWPRRVAAYLQQIDNTTAQQLVDILIADDWIEPLLPELQQPLLELLTAAYISTTDEREARLSQATPELVDITIPADINQELLDGLLQELPNQTEGFSAAVQALASGQGTQKDLEKAQRIAHTIKGAANTVGIRGAATLTHQIEDLLVMLVEHQRMPGQNLASTLVDAADCLEEICEALLERSQTPASAQPTLQAVLDWVNRLETDGISALDEDAPVSVATAETTASAQSTATAQEDTDEEQAQAATLRVPTSLIDNLLRLVGETLILTAQLQEKVNQSKEQNSALLNQHDIFQQLTSELEQQVDIRSVAMQTQNTNAAEGFDSLEMEQYNELHTITHQLVEAAADSQELDQDIGSYLHSLDELLVSQSRLQREVQELVMHTRMVPIKTIVPRLQRAIRQTCRVTGKQAELVLHGTDTLIDSDILGSLVDPLMHMLRNAVDHGIETREQRISAGKPAVGSIHLQCLREGTQIVIRCEDDGAGLDTEAIMQTARKRGLLDGTQDVNEEFLQRLILQPGFSTRQETTQTSGRGIGMDVVATQLQQIKGSVLIHSKPGEGTRFELRLPMSLMTTHGLLIRVRKQVMAISARGIEQILHPDDGHEITEDGKQRYSLEEEILDYTGIDELLRLPKDRRTLDRSKQPALLIREETLNCVVQIEQVIDSRDLVVKPLGPYLRKVRGIVGATILGDGSVVPVLDLPELIRNPLQGNVEQMDMTDTSIRRSLPVALVVDDSISARRSLAQVVRDAGYEIRTAKDGLEAATLMEKKRPDILLTDLEMPRMNGIELTSHVRANPDMVDMPVIMITSRSTEKHRQSASSAGVDVYLTKPFTEDQLLQHVHDLLEKTYDTTA